MGVLSHKWMKHTHCWEFILCLTLYDFFSHLIYTATINYIVCSIAAVCPNQRLMDIFIQVMSLSIPGQAEVVSL